MKLVLERTYIEDEGREKRKFNGFLKDTKVKNLRRRRRPCSKRRKDVKSFRLFVHFPVTIHSTAAACGSKKKEERIQRNRYA